MTTLHHRQLSVGSDKVRVRLWNYQARGMREAVLRPMAWSEQAEAIAAYFANYDEGREALFFSIAEKMQVFLQQHTLVDCEFMCSTGTDYFV